MDYNTKNIKLSQTLPEFKRKLKKHLIPFNCAPCRFWYYSVYTYSNNCLVSSYIVIGVKLGFIIFTFLLFFFIHTYIYTYLPT